MRRLYQYMAAAMLLGVGSCLPNNYLANLGASSLNAVTGVLLSDFFQVVLPPVR